MRDRYFPNLNKLGIGLFLFLFVSIAAPVEALGIEALLNLKDFYCHQTTEPGEDEVYILVSVRRTYGPEATLRRPSADGHWSMNDGHRSNSKLGPINIENNDIGSGQSLVWIVQIMEQDDGGPANWINEINGVVKKVDPTKSISDSVFGSLRSILGPLSKIKNTDDLIGGFSVQVTNNGGKLNYQYSSHICGTVRSDGSFEFTNDGTRYTGVLEVTSR